MAWAMPAFYKWRTQFGGMDASMMAEMKLMAEENRRLKRMYAEMSMQNDLLKEALEKKRYTTTTSPMATGGITPAMKLKQAA